MTVCWSVNPHPGRVGVLGLDESLDVYEAEAVLEEAGRVPAVPVVGPRAGEVAGEAAPKGRLSNGAHLVPWLSGKVERRLIDIGPGQRFVVNHVRPEEGGHVERGEALVLDVGAL